MIRGISTNVVMLYVMYIRRECILFIFFLNKNVYASKGVDLRSVCSHIASESGKMPVKVLKC